MPWPIWPRISQDILAKWKIFSLTGFENTRYFIGLQVPRAESFRGLARRDRFIFDIREQASGGTGLFSGSRVNL